MEKTNTPCGRDFAFWNQTVIHRREQGSWCIPSTSEGYAGEPVLLLSRLGALPEGKPTLLLWPGFQMRASKTCRERERGAQSTDWLKIGLFKVFSMYGKTTYRQRAKEPCPYPSLQAHNPLQTCCLLRETCIEVGERRFRWLVFGLVKGGGKPQGHLWV